MSTQKDSSRDINDNDHNDIMPIEKNSGEELDHGAEVRLGSISGFSEDERSAIIGEINNVVSANKIAVSKDRLRPKATKSSLVTPFVINIALFVTILIASIVGYLSFLGQKRTSIQKAQEFYSAESRLVREIIRQSEERIAAQEEELSSIRGQLVQVADELGLLEQNVEQRVESRRQELLDSLERDFEERARQLENDNYSREEVIALLEEPRREAEQQLNEELARFRGILDLEKAAREEELISLRTTLSNDLALKEAEISGLAQRLAQSEASLRALQEDQDLEITDLQQQLDEAVQFEDRYAQLQEDQQAAILVQEQMISLLSESLEDLRGGNFVQVEDNFDTVQGYLENAQYGSALSQEQSAFYLELVSSLREYRSLKENFEEERDAILASGEESISNEQLLVLQAINEDFQNLLSAYAENLSQVETLTTQATQFSVNQAETLLLEPFISANNIFPQFEQLYARIDNLQERFLSNNASRSLSDAQEAERNAAFENINIVIRYALGNEDYASRAAAIQRSDTRYANIARTIFDLMARINREDGTERLLLGFVASISGKEEFVVQNIAKVSMKVGTEVEVSRVGLQGELFIANGIIIRVDGSILQVQIDKGAGTNTGIVSKYDVVYLKR